MKRSQHVLSVPALVLALSAPAMAADDVDALRQQLAEQRALIRAQQQQLERQTQDLDRLSRRLDELSAGKPTTAPATASAAASAKAVQADSSPTAASPRDSVGDLNSAAVAAGDFPGAIKLPGGKDISLAIGGLVKTVAISDSDAEGMGADFLPSTLGTRRPDRAGAFSLDSTLTRLFIDGRAPAGDGQLRAYVEWDMNGTNDGAMSYKLRHAYGTWKTGSGTLLAGQTWSTMMDPRILPEGLTEPTVSGAIFMRQPQIRWTQPIGSGFSLHASIEDSSSSDIFDGSSTPAVGQTRLPDVVLGMEYDDANWGHLRLNGIVRDLKASLPSGGTDHLNAWGLALSGHVDLPGRDRWVFSGAYGKGLGRYLLGIPSSAGTVVDPATGGLDARDNWGLLTAYQHNWSGKLRSSFMLGHAKAKPLGWQPGDTFVSSSYGAANLMWQLLPTLTLGVEYAYGQLKRNDGTSLDNHRVAVGFQFY